MKKLQEILIQKDNLYTLIPGSVPQVKTVSVIVPFLNNFDLATQTFISLLRQKIPAKILKYEIVFINDGSGSLKDHFESLFRSQNRSNVSFIYIENKENLGRSTARNIGLIHSSGELVIFLDGDMIAPDTFIQDHIEIQNQNGLAVVIGINKDYIGNRELFLYDKGLEELSKNSKEDFRVERLIPDEWKQSYPEVPRENFGKVWHIIRDSDKFRNYGNGKIFGVWSLPFMFLSGNVSIRRNHLLQVGGFSDDFKGWGLEDTHLGAKLLGLGLYFIPLDSSMPIHRKTPKEELGDRFLDFGKNLQLYKKLLDSEFIKQNETDLSTQIAEKYSTLYEVCYF